MHKADFTQDAPGAFIEAIHAGRSYRAYVPNPLPPDLAFNLDLMRRLSEADRALGELNGVGQMLPNPHLLIGPFLRREAVASSRIEGTVTDIQQLFLFEADPDEAEENQDRIEVHNYVVSLDYGLKRLSTLPVSLRLMTEIHARLMSGVRGEDKRPGEFRNRQNMIGRGGQHPAEARFVPPPVAEMRKGLDDLERFIGHPSDLPVLIDLALIHYQFETIHPFLDGNGRLGRLLISLLLCERKCLAQPLLYLSDYFEQHKESYTDHLLAVSQKGDWTSWLGFFLDGVAIQSKAAVQRCNRLLVLWKEYRDRFSKAGNTAVLLRLVEGLFENPVTTISRAAKALDVTPRAAQQNIEKLVDGGVLREITGKARYRVYVAPDVMKIVADP